MPISPVAAPAAPAPAPFVQPPPPRQLFSNVSGRVWKSSGSKKSYLITAGNHSVLGWDARQLQRKKSAITKAIELEERAKTLHKKEEVNRMARLRREGKALKEKEREETVMMSAAKLKRMKKKQLRQFKKAAA